MGATMQSWWMLMTETDTALELRESPVPEPGPEQLRVRLHAAALNRGEFVVGHGPDRLVIGYRADLGE